MVPINQEQSRNKKSRVSVRIVTDSTSDLPPEICRELDITVVPLTVNFGDTGYKDGVDLSADEFYRKLIEVRQASNYFPALRRRFRRGLQGRCQRHR